MKKNYSWFPEIIEHAKIKGKKENRNFSNALTVLIEEALETLENVEKIEIKQRKFKYRIIRQVYFKEDFYNTLREIAFRQGFEEHQIGLFINLLIIDYIMIKED